MPIFNVVFDWNDQEMRLLKLYFAPFCVVPCLCTLPPPLPLLLCLLLYCLSRFSPAVFVSSSLSASSSLYAYFLPSSLSSIQSLLAPLLPFPAFLKSLKSFVRSSRTPTRGAAGLAGGQLPVTPPEAGAGATAALQLRPTLASPKGAAAASIRGVSTARWTLPTLGASTAKPTRFDNQIFIKFNVGPYSRYSFMDSFLSFCLLLNLSMPFSLHSLKHLSGLLYFWKSSIRIC